MQRLARVVVHVAQAQAGVAAGQQLRGGRERDRDAAHGHGQQQQRRRPAQRRRQRQEQLPQTTTLWIMLIKGTYNVICK